MTATLRPYSVGALVSGHDCYVAETASLTPGASRWWSYRDHVSTVQLASGEYVKSLTGWNDAPDLDAIRAAVDEIRDALGVSFPSGWATAFRRSFASPLIPATFNGPLAPAFAGGWQAALKLGYVPGPLYHYDIRSAYLGALRDGLPDPDTYRFTRSLAARPALFRVTLKRPEPTAPYPFNSERDVLATSDEIGEYGLEVYRVVAGVAWRRMLDPSPIIGAITRWTFWKHAARSYWGLWAACDGVTCETPSKRWTLPPLAQNIVWAHWIVSRVRLQLARVADRSAAHVYTDSVITSRADLATGPDVGNFRRVATYPRGLYIGGTGLYAEPGATSYAKAIGIPRNHPLRTFQTNPATGAPEWIQ